MNDVSGKQVYAQEQVVQFGKNTFELETGAQLAEGMYFVGKYTAYLTCCIVFCGKVNNIPHLLESTPSSVLKVILMLSTIMKRC
jgi:hypothetical protein